jgi:hypothetical protein
MRESLSTHCRTANERISKVRTMLHTTIDVRIATATDFLKFFLRRTNDIYTLMSHECTLCMQKVHSCKI